MSEIKIEITQEILDNFDMSKYEDIFLKSYPDDPKYSVGDYFPFWDMNRYHKYYRILAYFSTFYDNEILVDIGTRRGHSAASLAYNENNVVYTYNDKGDGNDDAFNPEGPENNVFEKMTNIKPFILSNYHEEDNDGHGAGALGNILGENEHKNILLKSSLIFMDVDPHSGDKETALFDFLVENDYKGITLWDDIADQLRGWFEEKESDIRNNRPHLTIFDLNDYSWKAGGTGVICFGEQEVILK